jgi:hypothetical protein
MEDDERMFETRNNRINRLLKFLGALQNNNLRSIASKGPNSGLRGLKLRDA